MSELRDAFTAPDPDKERRRRSYEALARITERHAVGEDRVRWDEYRRPMAPFDAVRRVGDAAAGSAPPGDGEPAVDREDLTAALSLLPTARAEFDQMELGILEMAKGRGMTWQEIAFGLGLGTAQAARQRHERLSRRAGPDA